MLKRKISNWQTTLIGLIIVEFVIFGSLNSRFLNITNLMYSVGDFLYIVIAALSMTFIIAAGGIDVSVGSIMGLVSIITGIFWIKTSNIILAIILGLTSGILAGALNGFLIVITQVNPLVITLGSSFLFSGLALTLSGFAGSTGFEGISGFPDSFINIANGLIFNIPNPLWILLILAIIFYILLHKTKFGRYIFLMGMNPNAARYVGIGIKKLTIYNFAISGLGGAMAGIFLASYFTNARSDLGADAPLAVITCTVLGGASIYGGEGSIIGTLLAGLLIGYLKYGLQMINITSIQTNVFLGLVLILAISGRYFWDMLSTNYKNKKAVRSLRR